jgi:uncharacterized membrane protein
MFAPFLGLWLLEPLLLLGAIPDLVINLLSAKPEQTTVYWQYTAGIVPFVLAASIIGASKLKRFKADPVSLAAVFAVCCTAAFSPIARIAIVDLGKVWHADPSRAAKSHALKLIPSGEPVSASNQLGGVLSDRRYIYIFPVVKRAAWVIVDANDETYTQKRWYRQHIAALNTRPGWHVVYRAHGVEVIHKG